MEEKKIFFCWVATKNRKKDEMKTVKQEIK